MLGVRADGCSFLRFSLEYVFPKCFKWQNKSIKRISTNTKKDKLFWANMVQKEGLWRTCPYEERYCWWTKSPADMVNILLFIGFHPRRWCRISFITSFAGGVHCRFHAGRREREICRKQMGWVFNGRKLGFQRKLQYWPYPIGFMYGIFTYIYHKNQLNVGKLYQSHLPTINC